jgi:Uma2 family endonuclease
MKEAVGLMTAEDLLALPEDGNDRELIRGRLIERGKTLHTPRHSRALTAIVVALEQWREEQPPPRGEVLAAGAGFYLRRDPDTVVGMDAAYVSAEIAAGSPENAFLIEGPPVLAVEILSPKDKHEDIVAKVQEYLGSGVALVWIVDPDLRTVTVHRADAPPALFNDTQELSGEPFLPGFRTPVADVF